MSKEVYRRFSRAETIRTGNHRQVEPSSRIAERFADALYRTVTERELHRALEIGMAQGQSTLAILAAVNDGGGDAHLTSVDPHQRSGWQGIGLAAVEDAGWNHLHRLIERPDYLALPELVAAGEHFKLVYIDGWHSFDHVLLDAFYADKLLDVGGVMAFNDCGMPSVRRVLSYIRSHWHWFSEIDVGLAPEYRAGNSAKALVRRTLRWPTQDRYLMKSSEGQVPWSFHRRF